MIQLHILVFFSIVLGGIANNRPVYKIALTQKGYAQFLQYDVDTPPLREFTFCTWLRLNDLAGDQSIFTYVGSGNNRYLRLWLDTGGKHLKITFNGRVSSSTPVELQKDVWRHICFSYQSDFGAWALYLDARLIFCEASQSIQGFAVPGGGSFIIGYGTSETGIRNGLEGEIYGATMISLSTIEGNHTLKADLKYKQKLFRHNQNKGKKKYNNYIVLRDLQTDEIRDFKHETSFPIKRNKSKSFIHFTSPHSMINHDVGIELASRNPTFTDTSTEKEILDLIEPAYMPLEEKEVIFRDFMNNPKENSNKELTQSEFSRSEAQDLPMILDYETPPPVSPPNDDYLVKSLEIEKPPELVNTKSTVIKQNNDLISDFEKPPPPQDSSKVYGQWTSSEFAGSVLKYLKGINFKRNKGQKKVPPTIPLTKTSDSFPYQSTLHITKLRLPLQVAKIPIYKNRELIKREAIHPQINLQIIENDLRSDILKLHAQTLPKQVEITSRGEAVSKSADHRQYRNVQYTEDSDERVGGSSVSVKISPAAINMNNPKVLPDIHRHRDNNLMTILPFIKSVEYFTNFKYNNKTDDVTKNTMYSKSLSNNKWHNVEPYSNDYTPRQFDIRSEGPIDINLKNAHAIKLPSVIFSHSIENRKLPIVKSQTAAVQTSKQSDAVTFLKYNHAYMEGNVVKPKATEKINSFLGQSHQKSIYGKSNFNKNIKIGNALNERLTIGVDDEQKKESFVGGDDTVPEINKYRSDLDNEFGNIPASLGPRACKNIEMYDRKLYVHSDENDKTLLLSPIREKNIAIDFIIRNYKKCFFEESLLGESHHVIIDWNKTPIRLFGGAFPKKTKELCKVF